MAKEPGRSGAEEALEQKLWAPSPNCGGQRREAMRRRGRGPAPAAVQSRQGGPSWTDMMKEEGFGRRPVPSEYGWVE
jgi:hypothetical protein